MGDRGTNGERGTGEREFVDLWRRLAAREHPEYQRHPGDGDWAWISAAVIGLVLALEVWVGVVLVRAALHWLRC